MPLTKFQISQLREKFPDEICTNVDLSLFSRWKVGGIAKCIISPLSQNSIIRCVKFCHEMNINFVIMGATSNILFADKGLSVLVINLNRLNKYTVTSNTVISDAGIWVPCFARGLVKYGLSGLEHIIGVPGTLGGLVYMNGGSQRKGIGSNVVRVKALSTKGAVSEFNNEECGFSYRKSVFQKNSQIILEVELRLHNSSSSKIRSEMLDILRSRRNKFPLKEPNCGSVFISNPDMYEKFGPPGEVIENCGLKGIEFGGAKVSNIHANFIVNNHNAKATDILQTIKYVQDEVFRKTGFHMESEVIYMDEFGQTTSAANVVIQS